MVLDDQQLDTETEDEVIVEPNLTPDEDTPEGGNVATQNKLDEELLEVTAPPAEVPNETPEVDWQSAMVRIDKAYQGFNPIMDIPVEQLIAGVQDSSQFQQEVKEHRDNLTVYRNWCDDVLKQMGNQ